MSHGSLDPFCRAVRQVIGPLGVFTTYASDDGREWTLRGRCNACGLCEAYDPRYLGAVQDTPHVVSGHDGKPERVITRQLRWHHEPGVPGAVEELGWRDRADIPVAPAMLRKIPGCAYSLWVDVGLEVSI